MYKCEKGNILKQPIIFTNALPKNKQIMIKFQLNKFNALINDLEIILKEKTKKCLFFIYLLTLFLLKILKINKKQ